MSESQIIEEKKNVSVQESKAKNPKTPREAKKPAVSDELLERALNGNSHSSEIKELIERVAKGAILSKENRAIEVIDSNVGAVNRVIKQAGLKGKVKARSTEEGKPRPSMVWRIA